jgi:hypothetical protein
MTLQVSKLDAARRQLEMAVRLFFVDADPISVHTLAAAAGEVLADLARREGKVGLLESMLDGIRPEKEDEVRAMLHEYQNFFKHADRDPEEMLTFNPTVNEYYLLNACQLYRNLTSERVPLLMLFTGWWQARHPDLIEETRQVHEVLRTIDPNDKMAFLRLLPEFEQLLLQGAIP